MVEFNHTGYEISVVVYYQSHHGIASFGILCVFSVGFKLFSCVLSLSLWCVDQSYDTRETRTISNN